MFKKLSKIKKFLGVGPGGGAAPPSLITVTSKSDFPPPVGGVITLSTNNVRYEVYGNVNLGADRIDSAADSVQMSGMTPDAGLTYTGTGVMMSTAKTLQVRGMRLICPSASGLLDAVDAGGNTILFQSCAFVGGAGTDLVCIDNYANVLFDLCGFVSGATGICLANTVTNFTLKFSQFQIGVTGINIDLGTAVSAAVTINNNVSELSATSTFINAAPNNGNITVDGGGTITDNRIDNTEVGSVISVGLSALDLRWLAIGNNNIIGSDRVNPTGWAFYVDGDTVTQTIPALEANAIKFSVDGAGPTSDSDFLPRVIRGSGELWDTTNDDILPITEGDSYVLRVAFTLTAKGGSPNTMTVVLDIGATAGVTIPIVETSIGIPNTFPRKVMIPIPIFAGSTFLSNKGQILMYTDAGTLDMEERSIFIERISSGAS